MKRGRSIIVSSGLIGFVKFVAVIGTFPSANAGSVSILTLLKPSGLTRRISAYAKKLLFNFVFARS